MPKKPVNEEPAEFIPGMDGFGRDLSRLITHKRLTPPKLANAMNVNTATVYSWISGRTMPTVIMLLRLAAALNVEPAFLLDLVQESDYEREGRAYMPRSYNRKQESACAS